MIQITQEELNKAYDMVNTEYKLGKYAPNIDTIGIPLSRISNAEELLTPQVLYFIKVTMGMKDKWVLDTEVNIIDEELV